MRDDNGSALRDQSVADLVKQLTEQTRTLARQEIELAKAELTEKGKKAGLGAGMFGAAGLFGFFAFAVLTACAVLALATALDGWLAALIVAVAVRRDRRRAGAQRQEGVPGGCASGARADRRRREGGRAMDEATRTGGPAVDEHERGPDEIRADIEQTREELGETVEALAAKTDVKAQARAKVDETKARARETVEAVKQRVAPEKADELKEDAQAKVDRLFDEAQAKVEQARQRALAKAEAVKTRARPASTGAPAYPPADHTSAARTRRLRGAAQSPATYVVIGALAGILLGVVMARR